MIDVEVKYTFVVGVEPGFTEADVAEAVREYIATVGFALDEPDSIRPVSDCDRCGGPWGEDQTCSRCTFSDGTPRPVNNPGPLPPE